MNETTLTCGIKKYLQEHGFLVWKLSDRFRSGIPDLYCCKDGQSFWFEVKLPDGRVSPLQEYDIRDLNAHGIKAAVVRSVAHVEEIIRQVK